MSDPKNDIDYLELNSTIKSYVSNVLALDGRAIVACLASITLFGVAAAHDLDATPIQLLGFTFPANNALFLILPIILVSVYLNVLLYLGWKTEYEFFKLVWAKKIAPKVKVITDETKERTEALNKDQQIGEILGISTLSLSEIVYNLERLAPDVRVSGKKMCKEEHKTAASQYVESLLEDGRQYQSKTKYELVDFSAWFEFVGNAHNICSIFIDEFFETDILDNKIISREGFVQKLSELSAQCSNPFGEVLSKDQIDKLDSQAKEANWWLSSFKNSYKRSRLSFGLILVAPGVLFICSVFSVYFYRGQEIYDKLLLIGFS